MSRNIIEQSWGQELVAREDLGPGRELTAIVLLNEHSTQLTPENSSFLFIY